MKSLFAQVGFGSTSRTAATHRKCTNVRLTFERLDARQLMSGTPLSLATTRNAFSELPPALVQPLTQAAAGTAAPKSIIGGYNVQGVILNKYLSLGGTKSFLGYPTTNELATPDGVGRYNHFQNGSIYWHPSIGAFEVHGVIRDKWTKLGGLKGLGYPTTDESTCPDGVGRYNHFQNGTMYWHPSIGAFEIHGVIRDKWTKLGGLKCLGYPTTDESPCPDGVGRYNHFQNGTMYWHPSIGAFEVNGAIRDKWTQLGGLKTLGYPLTDELKTPDGVGRYNTFQNGSIYWHPSTGAHVVCGEIRRVWNQVGGLQTLGYPTTDEYNYLEGRRSSFQNGFIYWTAREGARTFNTKTWANERTTITNLGSREFPNLGSDYEVLGPATKNYNCIAWSLGVTNKWIWPGATLQDFDKLNAQYGYRRSSSMDFSLQRGVQKIVLYGIWQNGKLVATHQARQEADGTWTSKLGSLGLIKHVNPNAVAGGSYGSPIAVYFK